MNKQIFSVPPLETITEVIKLMKKTKVSQILVEENNKIIGIVTEATLLEQDLKKLQTLRAKDVMQEQPPIVSSKTKLSVIATLLTQYSLVVLQKDNKYVGVATKSDLLNYLV